MASTKASITTASTTMASTAMASTTTTTTKKTDFDVCIENLGKAMKDSYIIDEDGNSINHGDDEMQQIQMTIDSVKERAAEAFQPLFEPLMVQIAEQQAQIDKLRAQISVKGLKDISSANSVAVAEPGEGELPTAAWIITNRKSKSGADLTGYNCFTMFYMAKHKSGFPPKGLWEQQNKAAWNALSKEVNSGGNSPASASAAKPAVVEVPETKGKGTKLTAYNMYTIEYMKNNPGQGFPPKGSWAKIPKDQVAKYQAQADALKAQRA